MVHIHDFIRRVDAIAVNAGNRLAEAGSLAANELQEIAKNEARWDDITGDARRAISGSSSVRGNILTIILTGKTRHSIFLELANERNWAVLFPTLRRWALPVARMAARRMNLKDRGRG
ncbi:MAG: hypothetical protein FWE29_04915 [Defluviitaleaceae bacterium]|nr:hypothetical protein [Defluviitaleaceae bacterium]